MAGLDVRAETSTFASASSGAERSRIASIIPRFTSASSTNTAFSVGDLSEFLPEYSLAFSAQLLLPHPAKANAKPSRVRV